MSKKAETELLTKIAEMLMKHYGSNAPEYSVISKRIETIYGKLFNKAYNEIPLDIMDRIMRFSKNPNMLLLSKDYTPSLKNVALQVFEPDLILKKLTAPEIAVNMMDTELDPYQLIELNPTTNKPNDFTKIPLIAPLLNDNVKIAKAIIEHKNFPNRPKGFNIYRRDGKIETVLEINPITLERKNLQNIHLLYVILTRIYARNRGDPEKMRETEKILGDTLIKIINQIVKDGGYDEDVHYIPMTGGKYVLDKFIELFKPSPTIAAALFRPAPEQREKYYSDLKALKNLGSYLTDVMKELKKDMPQTVGGRSKKKSG